MKQSPEQFDKLVNSQCCFFFVRFETSERFLRYYHKQVRNHQILVTLVRARAVSVVRIVKGWSSHDYAFPNIDYVVMYLTI